MEMENLKSLNNLNKELNELYNTTKELLIDVSKTNDFISTDLADKVKSDLYDEIKGDHYFLNS
jgi:hypothetical protein